MRLFFLNLYYAYKEWKERTEEVYMSERWVRHNLYNGRSK